MPGKACRYVLPATSHSNSGKDCEITCCRGACSAPDALRTITFSGTLSNSSSELLQLQELRREVQSSSQAQLAQNAAMSSAQILQNRCGYGEVCGFWTPDHTEVKSHLRQAHPHVWQEVGDAAGHLCAGHSAQTLKGQSCLFCRRKVHDKKKHPQQCVVLFQVCLCWLRAHPHPTNRGQCPPASVHKGTRSLEAFFAPKDTQRSSTPEPAASPMPPPGSIPVWGEGQDRAWHTYKVRSGVFHIGAEVTSGHYRSFWYCFCRDVLMTGDDAVRPTLASASDTKRINEGSFMLAKQ